VEIVKRIRGSNEEKYRKTLAICEVGKTARRSRARAHVEVIAATRHEKIKHTMTARDETR
jgi:hypothetical protein